MSGPAVPFLELGLREPGLARAVREAIERVLDRGWFVLGPEVEAFEREWAAAVGVAHAVGVGSGTDAISLALWALGVGPGDEVVTTPLTAAFTALAVSRLGARPVFADVEPDTLQLSAASVAERITPRTRAILPVHLYGAPCDLPALVALARERGLALVEDACQAHGARLAGRPLGGWADAGCFSFYPTKNLGAFGDGGIVVTNDEALAARVRRLRNGGQAGRYEHLEIGTNSRLDELQAAVLRAKLPGLAAANRRRALLAARYDEAFAGSALRPVPTRAGAEPAHHLYVVRAPEREGLRAALRAEGIETLVHYPTPVHLQPAYRDGGPGPGSCPNAERAAAELVSLPLHPGLAPETVDRIAAAARAYYG